MTVQPLQLSEIKEVARLHPEKPELPFMARDLPLGTRVVYHDAKKPGSKQKEGYVKTSAHTVGGKIADENGSDVLVGFDHVVSETHVPSEDLQPHINAGHERAASVTTVGRDGHSVEKHALVKIHDGDKIIGVGRVAAVSPEGAVAIKLLNGRVKGRVYHARSDQLETVKEVTRIPEPGNTVSKLPYKVGTRLETEGLEEEPSKYDEKTKQWVRQPSKLLKRHVTVTENHTVAPGVHNPAQGIDHELDSTRGISNGHEVKVIHEPTEDISPLLKLPAPRPAAAPPRPTVTPQPAPPGADVTPDHSVTIPEMPPGLDGYQRAYVHPKAVEGADKNVKRKVQESELVDANAELKRRLANAEVHIRFPSEVLGDLIDAGRMKSLHETGYTGGMDDVELRSLIESALFGLHRTRTPDAAWPIYGFVTDSPDGALSRENADSHLAGLLEGYGDISLVMHPHVRERTTVTIHDSFGTADADYAENVAQVRKSLNDAPGPMLGDLPLSFTDDSTENVFATSDIASMESYIEAQVHGGISIRDIHHIVMTSEVYQELDAVILSKLVGLGVEIQVVS